MTKRKKIMLALTLTVSLLFALNFLLEKQIHVKQELGINQNVEVIWEIMGKQFDEVHKWSSNFKNSKPGGKPKFPDLDYSQRLTITDRGETVQVLDSFDSDSYTLSYHITKGAPGIAKQAGAIWSLNIINPNKTKVVLEFKMVTQGLIGFLMTPIIKKGIKNSASEIAEELKYYVENGKPHPRKLVGQ